HGLHKAVRGAVAAAATSDRECAAWQSHNERRKGRLPRAIWRAFATAPATTSRPQPQVAGMAPRWPIRREGPEWEGRAAVGGRAAGGGVAGQGRRRDALPPPAGP